MFGLWLRSLLLVLQKFIEYREYAFSFAVVVAVGPSTIAALTDVSVELRHCLWCKVYGVSFRGNVMQVTRIRSGDLWLASTCWTC